MMTYEEKQILVNPYTAIRLATNTFKNIGEIFYTDRKYKLTREAWICSMFLLGVTEPSNKNWFFMPERDQGSPDFYCYSFKYNKQKKGSIREEAKLEVFEWRKEEKESDFIEALKKIKLNKLVDPQLSLVCYVRRNVNLPPALELNKLIHKLNPKVKEIWYLGDVTPDSKTWRVTQIYPNVLAVDLDYKDILNFKEEQSFILPYRGRSERLEFEPLGQQVLLTPEFEIKILG